MRFWILFASLVFALAGCPSPSDAPASEIAAATPVAPPAPGKAWTCSMHPDVRMHEAGRCPKCNMDLVREGAEAGDGDEARAGHDPAAPGDAYYCPMHPEVQSADAGRCPKCNMFLVKPGDEAAHSAEAPPDSAKGDAPKNPAHGAPGHDHSAH